jgi:integrase
MIKSKYKYQEIKISIRKVILTSGRHIDKNGECKIYIEIISFYKDKTRKTIRIPTGVSVNPKNWNPKKDDGYVMPKDSEQDDKNTIINRTFLDYAGQLEMREQGQWKDSFKREDLISIEEMFPKTTKTLIDWIDDYIKYRKETGSPYNTTKNYGTLKNTIERYETDRKIKLTFEDVNLTFSDDFYSFLLSLQFTTGTIQKTYTRLITFLNHYHDRKEDYNIKISDRFRNKRFKHGDKSVNEPHPISKNEFEILVKHTFKNPEMNRTKTRFLLGSTTGMRYSDLFTITPDMITNECIVYYPQKTRHKRDNKVVVPLNPISKGILEGLNYDSTSLYISNQKYNDGLERMFNNLNEVDEYKKMFDVYTTHDARDTFITTCIESGIDIPSLLAMCGQESYEVMKRYFKKSQEHAKEKMKQVEMFK